MRGYILAVAGVPNNVAAAVVRRDRGAPYVSDLVFELEGQGPVPQLDVGLVLYGDTAGTPRAPVAVNSEVHGVVPLGDSLLGAGHAARRWEAREGRGAAHAKLHAAARRYVLVPVGVPEDDRPVPMRLDRGAPHVGGLTLPGHLEPPVLDLSPRGIFHPHAGVVAAVPVPGEREGSPPAVPLVAALGGRLVPRLGRGRRLVG